MAVFVQLALPSHAREAKPRLSLRAFSLVPHPKIEPRAAPLFITCIFGVFGHAQIPRAVPGSFCILEVGVVKTTVEDEAVDVVVRQ